MVLSLLGAAPAEPLTASDPVLRQHLELMEVETDEDALIDAMIHSGRDAIEVFLRRRLITQPLRWTVDEFGCDGHAAMPLPVAPVQSVDQVQYLDAAGSWQVVDPAVYRLLTSVEPADLAPDYGQVWPVPRGDRATVRIDMTAGYGATGDDVPPRFLQALRLQVAHMFAHRGDDGDVGDLAKAVRRMLLPDVVWT